MSRRDHILKMLREACGANRQLMARCKLREIVERLYMRAYVWQHPEGVITLDHCDNFFETSTAVSVLFCVDSIMITFPPCIAEQIPVDKGGSDDYAVQLEYVLHGKHMVGSRLIVSELRLHEIALENVDGETRTLVDLLKENFSN